MKIQDLAIIFVIILFITAVGFVLFATIVVDDNPEDVRSCKLQSIERFRNIRNVGNHMSGDEDRTFHFGRKRHSVGNDEDRRRVEEYVVEPFFELFVYRFHDVAFE